jgi:hypothetical protein
LRQGPFFKAAIWKYIYHISHIEILSQACYQPLVIH